MLLKKEGFQMKTSKKMWLTVMTMASWIVGQIGLPTTASAWEKYNSGLPSFNRNEAINLNLFKGHSFKSKNTDGKKKITNTLDGIFSNGFVEMAHYSHRSHSSHRSHYSHYSSSYSGYSSGSSNSTYIVPPTPSDIMEIDAIQRQLNNLGYSVGSVDGEKGPNTIQAIKNFQIEYGLSATGIVDWQTEAYLNSTNLDIIRMGLERQGYIFNGNNGRTPELVAAIYDFQARHGLPQNGRIYLKMKQALGI
jgi:putative peptidoglycan binding domain